MEDPQIPGALPPDPLYQAQSSPPFTPVSSGYPPGTFAAPPPAVTDQGLSDTAAAALAYVTIIPAIVLLLVPPYNTRPSVKFHCFQCFGLAILGLCLGVIGMIPILGWLVMALGSVALFVIWVMAIVKASQGSYLKLPYISDFAAQQSGYKAGLL